MSSRVVPSRHARFRDPPPREATVPTRLVVAASAALITVSLLVLILSLVGVAGLLPVPVRTAAVCLVALTLPGLPVAALLRLPANGVFASVTIAVSLSVTILLSQLNTAAALGQDALVQLVVLGLSAAAVAQLVRREPLTPGPTLRVGSALVRRQAGIAVLAAAALLFASAVWRLDPGAAAQYGLIQTLGVDYFAGLALLALLIAAEYRRALFDPVMTAAANIALMVYVTMPVAWATGSAPFPTAFAHRYIINWIAGIGALPPPVDARMSWAGFFSAGAHLMSVGGLTDSEVFLTSASLVFSILLIFPVYAIGLVLAGNRRTAWLGVTVYVLFNWYQQDYFAPQAVAMQFYATIIAVLLWQLHRSDLPSLAGAPLRERLNVFRRIPGRVTGRDARWTTGVEAVLVMLLAAMVVSHQLTPIVTIEALVLFAVLGVTRYKLLWAAALLLFVAWFHYGAQGYWHGHLLETLADFGGVNRNLDAGVSGRIAGDPTYMQMQYLRIGATLLLFGIAALGWFRLRHSKFSVICAGLVLAPLSLVLMQSYGGEVVIRSFLYASPVLAPLAATAVAPFLVRAGRRSVMALLAALGAVLALALVLVTNRGLNTGFEQTSPETLAVTKQMQQLTDASRVAYWGQGLAFHVPRTLNIDDTCYATAEELADCTVEQNIDYIVVTSADEKYMQYRFGLTEPEIGRLLQILTTDRGFAVMYDGEDAEVLRRNDVPALQLKGPT